MRGEVLFAAVAAGIGASVGLAVASGGAFREEFPGLVFLVLDFPVPDFLGLGFPVFFLRCCSEFPGGSGPGRPLGALKLLSLRRPVRGLPLPAGARSSCRRSTSTAATTTRM